MARKEHIVDSLRDEFKRQLRDRPGGPGVLVSGVPVSGA